MSVVLRETYPHETQTTVSQTMDTVHYFEHWVWKGQDIVTRVYRQARDRYTAESGARYPAQGGDGRLVGGRGAAGAFAGITFGVPGTGLVGLVAVQRENTWS
jgi:hypothetical protein